jgi:putative ABC transport system ATP-binding protein
MKLHRVVRQVKHRGVVKMTVAVQTIDLSKTYTLQEIEVKALQGVSLKVQQGEAIAIMGPSGSGKTTLLNLIGALDTPTTGTILIENQDISGLDDRGLTIIRRHKIGFVFQFYNLIPVLSAAENIELPMLLTKVPADTRFQRVKELLEMIDLTDRAQHRPDKLSGGEQQRVAIARSLANNPLIVLADEPTGDLDEKTGLKVTEQLIELTKQANACLLTVTHDPVIGDKMDRTLQLRDGKLMS